VPRQWELTGAFGRHNLQLVERPVPAPGPGEVRLSIRAVSLNYRDHRMVEGRYDPRIPLPLVPVSDGVGVVTEVGEGVTAFAPGDRVCPTFSPTWLAGAPDRDAVRLTRGGRVPGVLAEQVVVGEHELVHVPEHLTDVEAATLPCAALTAWSALVSLGGVRAGDTVLTLGTGGVSLFAVQLARLCGARVVATTSTPEKAARLRALGAEFVVRYPDDDRWGRTVRRWAGDGVDHVVEVGGAGTLEQSLEAVRVGGTVSLIGVLAGGQAPLALFPVLMKQIRVQGVFVGSRERFRAMCRALRVHPELRPVVDRVFPFADAPEALAHLAEARHVGKVVVAVS
jgi:NADPH:quinone reductase-like Zn-dependent oxidoreductase